MVNEIPDIWSRSMVNRIVGRTAWVFTLVGMVVGFLLGWWLV